MQSISRKPHSLQQTRICMFLKCGIDGIVKQQQFPSPFWVYNLCFRVQASKTFRILQLLPFISRGNSDRFNSTTTNVSIASRTKRVGRMMLSIPPYLPASFLFAMIGIRSSASVHPSMNVFGSIWQLLYVDTPWRKFQTRHLNWDLHNFLAMCGMAGDT